MRCAGRRTDLSKLTLNPKAVRRAVVFHNVVETSCIQVSLEVNVIQIKQTDRRPLLLQGGKGLFLAVLVKSKGAWANPFWHTVKLIVPAPPIASKEPFYTSCGLPHYNKHPLNQQRQLEYHFFSGVCWFPPKRC